MLQIRKRVRAKFSGQIDLVPNFGKKCPKWLNVEVFVIFQKKKVFYFAPNNLK